MVELTRINVSYAELKDSEKLKLLQEMDDIHPGNCIRIKNLLNFYYQMSSHLQTPLDT